MIRGFLDIYPDPNVRPILPGGVFDYSDSSGAGKAYPLPYLHYEAASGMRQQLGSILRSKCGGFRFELCLCCFIELRWRRRAR